MKVVHEGNIVFTSRPGLQDSAIIKAPANAVALLSSAPEFQGVLTDEKAATKG